VYEFLKHAIGEECIQKAGLGLKADIREGS
jgi:hypothetical protein